MTALDQAPRIFSKETLLRGEPAQIECLDIAGHTFSFSRNWLNVVTLDDEWLNDVNDPQVVIDTLRKHPSLGADLFVFSQRLPDTQPRFAYHFEWESIAGLELETYDHWWKKQIEGATRNQIRKSQKLGVEVRQCAYDDEFVRGVTAIFNETPIRQGRRFWHYGKDVETVRRQFSRYLFREELIGAFYADELIGFVMLGKARQFADLGQIISKISHREKSVTSLLIAKAVEICCAQGLHHLVYAFWTEDSLGQFKRRSGFREVKLPRYYVPLSVKGRIALQTGTHRGLKQLLPQPVSTSLKQVRRTWLEWRERAALQSR